MAAAVDDRECVIDREGVDAGVNEDDDVALTDAVEVCVAEIDDVVLTDDEMVPVRDAERDRVAERDVENEGVIDGVGGYVGTA